MVTIKKIEIKDYFGKGRFEWNLNPVVNILGGKNGSGKSSIFKLCYALLDSEHVPDAIGDASKHLFGTLTMTFSNDWSLSWPHSSEMLHLNMDGDKPMAYIETSVVKDEKGNVRKHAELKEQIQFFLINSFEQHLSKAIQYWQRPKTVSLNDPTMLDLMIYDQIYIRNSDFSEKMEGFIDSPEENVEMRNQYAQIYKKVYSELNHFLEGYDNKISSTFEFTREGSKIGYEHLSMGEKQILLLLLMVGNTKQEPCVFFMDEPDLSMHIDWKEELVTRLHDMNPNMQIILSTHAPSVITGWMDCVEEVSHLIKK